MKVRVKAKLRYQVSGLLGVTLLACFGVTGAEEKCETLLAEVERSAEAGAAARLQKGLERLQTGTVCDEATKGIVSGRIGELVQKALSSNTAGRVPATEVEGLLGYAVEHGQGWQAAEMLGDFHFDNKRYTESAEAYKLALDSLQEAESSSSAPTPEAISELLGKAERASLLAPQYVAQTRGLRANKVSLPITFKYDSTEFTPKGEAAVADLLNLLKEGNNASISLIGHTDPRGNPQYNKRLSLRRAAAVRDYLQKHGFPGAVDVDGRGAEEPLPVDSIARYSQEELYQMYRRVELRH